MDGESCPRFPREFSMTRIYHLSFDYISKRWGGIFHNAEETISSLALSLQEDQSFSRIKFHDRIIISVINLLLKMENLSN